MRSLNYSPHRADVGKVRNVYFPPSIYVYVYNTHESINDTHFSILILSYTHTKVFLAPSSVYYRESFLSRLTLANDIARYITCKCPRGGGSYAVTLLSANIYYTHTHTHTRMHLPAVLIY